MPPGAPCQISCGAATACGTAVQRRRPHWRQLWRRQAAATSSVGGGVPRRLALQVHAALFDPPPFDPSKLTVSYLSGALPARLATPRRYTLTHNDLTGALTLTIGPTYNQQQLAGWYTRILRDEILAEWLASGNGSSSASGSAASGSRGGSGGGSGNDDARDPGLSLHIYCHVSGEEMWPAPPRLRSFIFQREMGLVLDTITHAEAALLVARPDLANAPVCVHLRSDVEALNRVVEWGRLGSRATWLRSSSSMLGSLFGSDEDDAEGGSGGSWGALAGLFSSASSSGEAGQAEGCTAPADSCGAAEGGSEAGPPLAPEQAQSSSRCSSSSSPRTSSAPSGGNSRRGTLPLATAATTASCAQQAQQQRARGVQPGSRGAAPAWTQAADLDGLGGQPLPAVKAVLAEPRPAPRKT